MQGEIFKWRAVLHRETNSLRSLGLCTQASRGGLPGTPVTLSHVTGTSSATGLLGHTVPGTAMPSAQPGYAEESALTHKATDNWQSSK